WGNRWDGTVITGAGFRGSDLSCGGCSSSDWALADFTGCDLTGGALGELDARRINLDGVKLDGEQALQLVESLGVIVHR
ncbi:pentapeptide repeat-containing protein, partial [Escherichia coli]|uniref:pentapeptide repeat-containing protein n=1 Tax=Escherichia coli TaxID=562 RepID=UPI0032DA2BC6